ncbi:peptide chain release factor N(5)-glutamine methyltransferase [bacterium]|nr:peptide chain release factor N(5)-glutamine methyltransferase [bacterium]
MATETTGEARPTVLSLIGKATGYLAGQGVSSPRLDTEILLAHVLSLDRVGLYCAFERELTEEEVGAFRELIRRRGKREPVAYIVGVREFFSRPFAVTPAVLIPRPETEHVVEAALEWIGKDARARVLDVGTGSGAIAVTIAAERPNVRVVATDDAAETLVVARQNAERHGVGERVEFLCGAFDAGAAGPFDLVVSNPPYVDPATRSQLAPDVIDFEPSRALFAESDGLAVIFRLAGIAPALLAPGGRLVVEIGYDQGEAVTTHLQATGAYDAIEVRRDLAGKPRVALARKIADAAMGKSIDG